MYNLQRKSLQNQGALNSTLTPMVIETSGTGERAYDIYSRLLRDRVIFISGVINDDMASAVIAQILFLQLESKTDDIKMYIMSPGGSVSAAMAIYDTMQHVPNDVATYCIGEASSAAAFLLASGAQGKRHSLPGSRIMIHQPWSGVHGSARDIEIHATEISAVREQLYARMSFHIGKDVKQIAKDCDRDFYMSSAEAKKYGIIDKVLMPDKLSKRSPIKQG